MTNQEWLAEVTHRIGINEGSRSYVYKDTMGINTIGIGCNIDIPGSRGQLAKIGVTDVDGVYAGTVGLSSAQIAALFELRFSPIEEEAKGSLVSGIYDSMTDARRCAIVDFVFNLGNAGWLGFSTTRNLISEAQAAKNSGAANAHDLFVAAADHIRASAYAGQVGNRAKRNAAMIQAGVFCEAYGDGSDIL